MIERIKQEIERRMKELPGDDTKTTVGADAIRQRKIYNDLLSFIKSLEKEEQEDADFVKQELERIREAQKKVNFQTKTL